MTRGDAATAAVAALDAGIHLEYAGYRARIGICEDIRAAALTLRALAFRDGTPDHDDFDPVSLHGLVSDGAGVAKVAFRMRVLPTAAALRDSYTGQVYDLSPLAARAGPYLELGRICQGTGTPDIMALRLAWAAIGVSVDRTGASMLIGCSSFPGADPDRHHDALAALRAGHLGPDALRPGQKAPTAIALPEPCGEARTAPLPHLLRSYLNMGGWVGDHAVRDTMLDTLHVFTGLCVGDIPERRKARLRALAQAGQSAPHPS